MSLPPAILFDLDDTIIDYSGGVFQTWRAVCEDASAGLGRLDAVALHDEINVARDWYWADPQRHHKGRRDLVAASARIVEIALGRLDVDVARAEARAIAEDYRSRRDAGLSLVRGAVDTLERLNVRGCRLGLVTNGASAAQHAKIDRFDLARLFEHIQIEGEFGAGKPDERVYRAALTALNAQAAEA